MPLVSGLVIALLLFLLLETVMRMTGNTPGVQNGVELWGLMRSRVYAEHSLVLIGGSRMQLAIDTAELAKISHRPVVQLAIDAQLYGPVLRDLAEDENFHGTVLVDTESAPPTVAGSPSRHSTADEWVAWWRAHMKDRWSARMDATLALHLQEVSGWFASDIPGSILLPRLLAGTRTSRYIINLPDRSRRADYGPPEAQQQRYIARSLRNYGRPFDLSGIQTLADFEDRMNKLLSLEQPPPRPSFDQDAAQVANWTRQIRARGGQVIFVVLPRSGLVYRIEETRTPRALYWDRFMAATGGRGLYFSDDPSLASYRAPDGSHLDQKQVTAFTRDLYQALRAKKLL